MIKKSIHIWMWLENGRILKAISCVEDGTVKIYNEDDRLILKRTGLNAQRLAKSTHPPGWYTDIRNQRSCNFLKP